MVECSGRRRSNERKGDVVMSHVCTGPCVLRCVALRCVVLRCVACVLRRASPLVVLLDTIPPPPPLLPWTLKLTCNWRTQKLPKPGNTMSMTSLPPRPLHLPLLCSLLSCPSLSPWHWCNYLQHVNPASVLVLLSLPVFSSSIYLIRYLAAHPEVTNLLNDFISEFLLKKPSDILLSPLSLPLISPSSLSFILSIYLLWLIHKCICIRKQLLCFLCTLRGSRLHSRHYHWSLWCWQRNSYVPSSLSLTLSHLSLLFPSFHPLSSLAVNQ